MVMNLGSLAQVIDSNSIYFKITLDNKEVVDSIILSKNNSTIFHGPIKNNEFEIKKNIFEIKKNILEQDICNKGYNLNIYTRYKKYTIPPFELYNSSMHCKVKIYKVTKIDKAGGWFYYTVSVDSEAIGALSFYYTNKFFW